MGLLLRRTQLSRKSKMSCGIFWLCNAKLEQNPIYTIYKILKNLGAGQVLELWLLKWALERA